jgi:hypothetical protein
MGRQLASPIFYGCNLILRSTVLLPAKVELEEVPARVLQLLSSVAWVLRL